MADETVPRSGPEKTLSQPVAMTLMVIGGVMLLLAIFIPTEPGTTAQYVKLLFGLMGFVILGFGSYKRPKKGKE